MEGVIEKNGTAYAYFFQGNCKRPGVSFLTPKAASLQVGTQEHPAGYSSRPHVHPPAEFHVHNTGEFIYVERGKIRAIVYDENFEKLGEGDLGAGDFLLFLHGGHEVQVLEDSKFIEVKQGPYPGDEKAKVFLRSS